MAGRTVKLFLDSNVILSGLLSDKGAPRIILDILSLNPPFLTGLTGEYNLLEIERNLKRKLPAVFPIYRKYFSRIHLQVIPLPRPEELEDFIGSMAGKDVPVLVSAIRGGADFLVTGDQKHFGRATLGSKASIEIVTPTEFVDRFLPEIVKSFSDSKQDSN